jgi:hypothetical protein
MKTIMKLVAGTAVLAATAGVAHADISTPSTGSSQLLFFVTDPVKSLTYTEVLTQTVGSGSSLFAASDATSNAGNAVAGVSVATIDGKQSFTYNADTNSALQTFITANQADGLQYGIMAGAYTGQTSVTRRPIGNALAVTTGADLASLLQAGEAKITGTMIAGSGLTSDISTLNQGGFDASGGTASGVIGTPASVAALIDWYGTGINVVGAVGSTLELYGVSSAGTPAGPVLAYDLGHVSFDGHTLSFTGNAVPLPAAAWLFGSGLLGLLGIGRRRSFAAAA